MLKVAVVIIAGRSEIQCGIYSQNNIIEQFESKAKTLDALVEIWGSINKRYEVDSIYYSRGPGSLSALKLLHIFVHTLETVKKIKLFAVDHFYFNQEKPIRAFGNQFFKKIGEEIILESGDDICEGDFILPQVLRQEDFNQECVPLYIVPPI